MKAIDLLKYLDKADPKYIEEASDYNLLLYRKRRKRTRVALAASLALVVLAGVFLTKPALYAWETRNTVTSWPASVIRIPGTHYGAETSPFYVSAEMPDQKKFAADTPFTLSVGLGQVSDYEYATLSIKAYGFEITDKEGNTVTDRYVRTLSDFNSVDYGVTYGSRHNVTGCSYLEDFTLRYVGSENTTGWGVIEFSLRSGDQSSSVGDAVTVYYTLRNGVLKLTDKNPVRDGSQNGSLGTVLEESNPVPNQAKTVEFSHEGYRITVSVTDPFLARGEAWQEKIDIDGIPMLSDFMVALHPKDREAGDRIRLLVPGTFSSTHDWVIPADAPLGSYDLVVTWYGSYADSEEERPQWVFEDFVTVTESGTVTLSKEDFSIRMDMPSGALTPGQYLGDKFQITAFHIPTQKDYSTENFTAELVCAESLRQEDFSFTIKRPIRQNGDGSIVVLSPRVPGDAPIGSYDLVVTDLTTGFVWAFENAALILPADIPAYEDFIFEADSTNRVISQGDNWPGGWDPFFLTLNGEDVTYHCRAVLEYRSEQGGESYSITLMESIVSSLRHPDFVPVDAPAGKYDLVVTHVLYGYTWRAESFIQIMENPEAPKFGFYHDMGKKLTVSRSSGEVYSFIATVENRRTLLYVDGAFDPEATLAMQTVNFGWIPTISLKTASPLPDVADRLAIRAGQTGNVRYELIISPDTPCGLYDLTLSYEDCTVTFKDAVEVVP